VNTQMIFRAFVLGALLTGAGLALAETSEPMGQVMLFGTFHFSNPGQDAVKTRSLDVTTAESQRYLEALARRIATSFRPTQVLLEYPPSSQADVERQFQEFLSGHFDLPVNEIYQLGFRVAKYSGLERVKSFDHQDIEWQADRMLEYAEKKDPQAAADFNHRIEELTAKGQLQQESLSLQQLLELHNDADELAANKALYIDTNAIGVRDGYAGADAAASWWHRNFRMYANIQAEAQPGERVLVIGGSGHVAIISDFLQWDSQRKAADVKPLLKE
jgi:hypothetical protein